ncbi:hypothetical protein HBI73_043190 [Parastagonospora nodorum]|nr:hypothetical protein HBH49_150040 [Parastagonospora nodorum]KAH4924083.1 hypothetical protein HBI79_163170 [Parastagonospora nodorum]KAH5164578.1 hypothetical protein HBI73_043190 [Parastagonospora nodorum]KAH5227306.1 hypothetical protein HBI62_103880 [Parastagonospora nodorum]KAH5266925.1 hypothetical protein HBI72_080140 [Parastagonospora nodorum]
MPLPSTHHIQYKTKTKSKKKKDWIATWDRYTVNLKRLGLEYVTSISIFTRESIQRCRLVRDKILNHRDFLKHREPDLQGKGRIVWKRRTAEDDIIDIKFMTAVELHPKMYVRKRRSDGRKLLYAMDGDSMKHARITGRPDQQLAQQ